MIEKRFFPSSFKELLENIREQLSSDMHVVVQAGHFLVYYDHTEDMLLPCIKEVLTGPRFDHINETVGHFPLLTWEMGLELLASVKCKSKDLCTVVNDWQYIDKSVGRMRFYDEYKELFVPYLRRLSASPDVSMLTQRQLGMKVKTGVWFSEISLRNQFKRAVQKKIKHENLDEKYLIENNDEGLTCSLVDAVGKKQQIYCAGKRGDCTHEIAELNRQTLASYRSDLFINFYPIVCKNYVQTGTDWAYELFLDKQKTINIGMPTSYVFSRLDLFENCEVSVHIK